MLDAVICPVVSVTLANEGLEDVHAPPGVPSVSVIVAPWQSTDGPTIAKGAGFTVNVRVTRQDEPPNV